MEFETEMRVKSQNKYMKKKWTDKKEMEKWESHSQINENGRSITSVEQKSM